MYSSMVSFVLGVVVSFIFFQAIGNAINARRDREKRERMKADMELWNRAADDIAPYIKGATHD